MGANGAHTDVRYVQGGWCESSTATDPTEARSNARPSSGTDTVQSPLTGDGVALLSPAYTAAGPHFAFHFDDRAAVDAVHAQLVASGHPVGPVHDHRDGTASFYLQDPEGNWLEMLYEPPAGIPSNQGGAAISSPTPAASEQG